MKKKTKILLHTLLGGIVSAISYIGFIKGVEALNKKMESDEKKPEEDN